ncbi:HD-GYP domain-containing protein [Acanthopleuribacter pedis]|uniref:DUF3391 domain-containing protein n=1 Tax=Acanthopleuribacter pedis TaxID=442870 RepID=A0A8J7Q656_9BACT|nr:HD-GYP domain-containing protein [Acanthopleuribacter pedis]MBO1321202.1 DUF3391 domain-containing protein [Acanthopleuribacter pedis]
MQKKITIDQLRPGMYVVSTNRSWISLPFFRKNIPNQRTIDKLRKAKVTDLVIDLNKGVDVEVAIGNTEPLPEPGSPAAVQKQAEQAAQIQTMVFQQTAELMEEIRAGKVITEEQADQQVGLLMDQIFEDPQSMLCVSVLRNSDEVVFDHCVNLSILALFVGKSMRLDEEALLNLGKAALLHDIGKCMLPKEIINKKGRLTQSEQEHLRQHVDRGLAYLGKMKNVPAVIRDFVGQHHEFLDGSGYPGGLRGPQISDYGKLACVLNAYDEKIHRDSDGAAVDPRGALEEMQEQAGRLYDPEALKLLVDCLGPYPPGTILMLDSGEMAVAYEPNPNQPEAPKVLILTHLDGTFRDQPLPAQIGQAAGEENLVREIVTPMTLEDTNFNPLDILAKYGPQSA